MVIKHQQQHYNTTEDNTCTTKDTSKSFFKNYVSV
jgi:hypothetical protein